MEVDAIAHVPISTLFLSSQTSVSSATPKKHLSNFYYLMLRGRAFTLMNASVLLSPERGYADGTSYPPILFQARPTISA